MQEIRLISLLKNLDKAEFRRLKSFLQSPFFNANDQVLSLYLHLKKYYPAFDSPKLTKQKVFQQLYPELTYTDTKMRLLISDFKLLVEEYLVQLQLKKQPLEHKKLWINALDERNMTKLYFLEEQKLQLKLKSNQIHDAHRYYELHQLNHQLLFKKTNHRDIASIDLLLLNNEYLDLFYLTRKLQYTASAIVNSQLFKVAPKLSSTDLMFQKIALEPYNQFPLFNILQRQIELLENGHKEEDYLTLKQLVLHNFDNFAPELKLNILQLLFNHCINLYKTGNMGFLKEQFEWYKFGFGKKVLVEQVQLTDVTYKNTIVLGCHYQDLAWVKAFIDNYTDYLLPAQRRVAKSIGLAYYYFNKADYDAVIQQLQSLDFGTKHALNGRSLLLQSYIELYFLQPANPDYIFSYATAFKRFLKRGNYGANTVLAYSNYIDLSIKILAYHESNKWDFNTLNQLLNEDQPIVSKPWLIRILKK